jgi:hypothetical protein
LTEIQALDPSYVGWLLSPKGIECEETRQLLREHLR